MPRHGDTYRLYLPNFLLYTDHLSLFFSLWHEQWEVT